MRSRPPKAPPGPCRPGPRKRPRSGRRRRTTRGVGVRPCGLAPFCTVQRRLLALRDGQRDIPGGLGFPRKRGGIPHPQLSFFPAPPNFPSSLARAQAPPRTLPRASGARLGKSSDLSLGLPHANSFNISATTKHISRTCRETPESQKGTDARCLPRASHTQTRTHRHKNTHTNTHAPARHRARSMVGNVVSPLPSPTREFRVNPGSQLRFPARSAAQRAGRGGRRLLRACAG